jgi:hypothetical protein
MDLKSHKGDQPLDAPLNDFVTQFEAVKADATALTSGLDNHQFNWHPEPGRWSIAECIDHLNVIGSQLLPRMVTAIEDARARGVAGHGPFRYGTLGGWFARSMEPPVKKRFKTMKLYVPPPDRRLDEVVPAFLALQDDLIGQIHRANGLDVSRIKVTSPAARWLRINLAAWFAATAAHERRHLWQARNVMSSPGFPRSPR